MRRTTLARGGALLTAAILALSLGAGPATAADSPTTESGSIAPDTSFSPDRGASFPAPSAARTGARASGSDVGIASAGDVTIHDYSISSGVMGTLDPEWPYVYAPGRITFNYFNGARLGTPTNYGPTMWTHATVNGVYRNGEDDWVPMWANRPSESAPGAEIPRHFGAGKIVLGPEMEVYTTHDAADGPWTIINATSNTFYVRRDTWGTFKASHSGSTVSFGARARIRGTDGSALTAKTGYIQYASSGTWKTLKTLSLDSTGNAKWSYKTSSKRTYRFMVKRTSVINGMTIKLPKL